ncbi:hypothetical protein GCM10009830_44780 [Glycomyces endophyticus]|uniref:Uncharacterized protein n=1 Tax=Glycomyces endophyticus TaxID=480996 RepID=A0ABN2HR71_9ACTN
MREVAVEGPGADAGPLGDRLQGRVRPLFGEDGARGVQEPLHIACGIGAQGAFGFRGHPRILASTARAAPSPN